MEYKNKDYGMKRRRNKMNQYEAPTAEIILFDDEVITWDPSNGLLGTY